MIKYILLFLATTVFTFTSCSKDDDKVENKPKAENKPKGEVSEAVKALKGEWAILFMNGMNATKNKCMKKGTLSFTETDMVQTVYTSEAGKCIETKPINHPYTVTGDIITIVKKGVKEDYCYTIKADGTLQLLQLPYIYKKVE